MKRHLDQSFSTISTGTRRKFMVIHPPTLSEEKVMIICLLFPVIFSLNTYFRSTNTDLWDSPVFLSFLQSCRKGRAYSLGLFVPNVLCVVHPKLFNRGKKEKDSWDCILKHSALHLHYFKRLYLN